MARIRYLKPDFFKDDDVATLPFWVRILYQGLWVIADKEGRLEDRPKRIHAEIFPYDKVDIEKGLSVLSKPKNGSRRPFIIRYVINNESYIQILKWENHQKPHHTEANSSIPPYNGDLTVTSPLNNGEAPPTSSELLVNVNGEGNGEGNGECASHKLPHKDVLRDIRTAAEARGVDWDSEMRKMDIWLAKNKNRKKTDRFIANWMMRADVVVPSQARRVVS